MKRLCVTECVFSLCVCLFRFCLFLTSFAYTCFLVYQKSKSEQKDSKMDATVWTIRLISIGCAAPPRPKLIRGRGEKVAGRVSMQIIPDRNIWVGFQNKSPRAGWGLLPGRRSRNPNQLKPRGKSWRASSVGSSTA